VRFAMIARSMTTTIHRRVLHGGRIAKIGNGAGRKANERVEKVL